MLGKLLIVPLVFLCVGCATNRSIIPIEDASFDEEHSVSRSVIIRQPIDNRKFEAAPREPSTPSLDPSEPSNDSIRARALGRKRNSYGKGLGDLLVGESQSVASILKNRLEKAFGESGYRVITDESKRMPNTEVVNVDIRKFWAWMNPGFWTITLSHEVSTLLTIDRGGSKRNLNIETRFSDNFGAGTESNWKEVVNKSLEMYTEDVKAKVKKP